MRGGDHDRRRHLRIGGIGHARAARHGPDVTEPIATNAEPTNTALAFTGAAHTTRLAIVGLAMVLVGVAAMLLARRRRPSVRC